MQNLYIDTKYMIHKSLLSLIKLLHKAEEQRQVRGVSVEEIMNARLAEDMFPFSKQVQIVSDTAKGYLGRVGGIEVPKMEDNEETLLALVERIEKTAQLVMATSEDIFNEAPDRKIELSYFPGKYQTAEDYTRDFVIPNFFFHYTTAYAILRKEGFEIGKPDFLGGLNLRDM